VRARAAGEEGFGLIELLFAMVMLNIGILALVAAFQTGAVALSRSSATSNGAAVADRVMEVFRGLQTCSIYLNAPNPQSDAHAGADVNGLPDGIPASTSSWYTQYRSDSNAWSVGGNAYFDYAGTSTSWATNRSTELDPIAAAKVAAGTTCPVSPPTLPSGSPDPTKAVQYVTGPDGRSYPVFIYIVDYAPTGAGTLKQVTVDVWNPRQTTQLLAHETSYFDPNVSG
jgi:type II secretory pathway pseudopilin PulG